MTVYKFQTELNTRSKIDALPLGQHRNRDTAGFGILVRPEKRRDIITRTFNVQVAKDSRPNAVNGNGGSVVWFTTQR